MRGVARREHRKPQRKHCCGWELTRFLLNFTQDVEESRFHSVAVQCVFPGKTRRHFQDQPSNKTHTTSAVYWGCKTDTLFEVSHIGAPTDGDNGAFWSMFLSSQCQTTQLWFYSFCIFLFLYQVVFRLISFDPHYFDLTRTKIYYCRHRFCSLLMIMEWLWNGSNYRRSSATCYYCTGLL